jgi:hypothetical protein
MWVAPKVAYHCLGEAGYNRSSIYRGTPMIKICPCKPTLVHLKMENYGGGTGTPWAILGYSYSRKSSTEELYSIIVGVASSLESCPSVVRVSFWIVN